MSTQFDETKKLIEYDGSMKLRIAKIVSVAAFLVFGTELGMLIGMFVAGWSVPDWDSKIHGENYYLARRIVHIGQLIGFVSGAAVAACIVPRLTLADADEPHPRR